MHHIHISSYHVPSGDRRHASIVDSGARGDGEGVTSGGKHVGGVLSEESFVGCVRFRLAVIRLKLTPTERTTTEAEDQQNGTQQ